MAEIRNTSLPFRIVGGEPTTSNEFPWLSSLTIFTSRGTFSCGGMLIHPEWVLSAAHCLDSSDLVRVEVINNTSNLNNLQNAIESEASASNCFVHNEYNPSTINNDIALIKISNVKGDINKITPIKINDTLDQQDLIGQEMTIAGYGLTSEGGSSSTQLMKAKVPIVSDSVCKSQYGNINLSNKICAGGNDKDSCQGDSGGPLFKDEILYGLTSFGIGCARPGIPGVYTFIKSQKDWIIKTINDPSITDNIFTKSSPVGPIAPTSSPITGPPTTVSPTKAPRMGEADSPLLSTGAIIAIVIVGILLLIGFGFAVYKYKDSQSNPISQVEYGG